ncbi:twin-arginine translocase TatA/TatE family subunit [Gloeobacter kilaueensis]|uniref:Sec-independent protein translocase protein TatA n=1 Tax=Gloeobacter kilaueensis (strain ATCC BAA-2537 / CCAP 1431/1 / ULC 316 / JS1) TaxID=1183438 RepID=U5QI97_GLOK1|nr:twin-arginine translocase TatA/TatE family subunit [Gloeobacter kilaueensis]AGY57309.1 twin arginine translocase protein A [Gloeobacter kilaueensis JS1]
MELFGVGPLELVVIGLVALLVFGPKKLPELAQNVGRLMRGLKDASRDFERELRREFVEPQTPVAFPERSFEPAPLPEPITTETVAELSDSANGKPPVASQPSSEPAA